MTKRLEIIFSAIPECEVFADVGCDHGYIASAVIKSGKCKRAIVSDISAKCLKKAQELLKEEIDKGVVSAVVSNGFEKVFGADCALIAGMGGMEIISIIKNAKEPPENLVLQPMKNAPELRSFLVEKGYAFVSDRVFFAEDKYYQLMVVKKGNDSLSDDEIKFGRDNLKERGQDFLEMIKKAIDEYEKVLSNIDEGLPARKDILTKIEELKRYV